MNDKPSISVIGNGVLPPGSDRVELAERLGRAIVDQGWRLVCGGMGGVMMAAARGARRSPNHVPGSVVGILPVTRRDAGNPHIDVAIPTGLGNFRNGIVAMSDVVVAVGGGAGTLSEMAFAWMHDRPIVAFRVEGWSGRLADQRLDGRVRFKDIPPDEDVVRGVDTVEEAVEAITALI